ncbi:serine/threonine-protein kinase [Pontibacter sp. G13]|uniref:serine/threonine-protein kinase n=1 Tax=Pontibacter sp. G13 TaxID=3074898 RepID=UPI00288A76DA|nr:serine/threonine-protein kinase [Pontibacter sp. G13]WNJ18634.1 serine/threonine-protein kinase [Pontibacter sp. G13]
MYIDRSKLFATANDLPPEQRRAYLETQTDDVSIIEEILAMINLQTQADRYFDQVASQIQDSLQGSFPGIGSEIGPYRLNELLGEGGWACVFSASRIDGAFQQQVAIKVLRNPLLTPEKRRMFESEKNVLARLDHASIVRILDAGTTEAGFPYLVMPLVEGEPMESLGQSLRHDSAVFLEICQGVAYAHRNLVVHLDIKPGNILIDPETGAPKLLDFGISHLLTEAEPDVPHNFHTPAYAAPEQLIGAPTGTWTDIYQLGNLGKNMLSYAKYSKKRKEEVHAIWERCMAEDPGRRYGTVGELIADFKAFEQDRPVSAVHGDWTYRIGKTIARNRRLIALTATLGLGILIASLVAVFNGQQADQQEARGTSLFETFTGLFQAPNPYDSPIPIEEVDFPNLTVKEFLGHTEEELMNSYPDAPSTYFELLLSWRSMYIGLNLMEETQSVETKIRQVLANPEGLPQEPIFRAQAHLANGHLLRNEFEPADSILRRLLPELDAQVSEEQLFVLNNAIQVAGNLGQMDRFDSLMTRSMLIQPDSYDDSTQFSFILKSKSFVEVQMGDFEEAIQTLRASESYLYGLGKSGSMSHADLLDYLGDAYLRVSKLDSAREAYERSMELTTKFVGESHPYVYESRRSIANIMGLQGDSLGQYEELNSIVREMEANALDNSMFYVNAIHNLGNAELALGKAQQAKQHVQKSLSMLEQMGHQGIAVPIFRLSLARAEFELGNFRESLASVHTGQAAMAQMGDADHYLVQYLAVMEGGNLIKLDSVEKGRAVIEATIPKLSGQTHNAAGKYEAIARNFLKEAP